MEETDKIKTSTITATWTCARPLTQSPATSLSPNWSDMDLRGGLFMDKEFVGRPQTEGCDEWQYPWWRPAMSSVLQGSVRDVRGKFITESVEELEQAAQRGWGMPCS